MEWVEAIPAIISLRLTAVDGLLPVFVCSNIGVGGVAVVGTLGPGTILVGMSLGLVRSSTGFGGIICYA